MEECIICFEENDFVTLPCNHKVCVLCYPKLKRCPLCNITINETIVIEVNPVSPSVSVSREPWYFDTRVRMLFYLIIILIFVLSMSRFE
jgi:hypothetical protein